MVNTQKVAAKINKEWTPNFKAEVTETEGVSVKENGEQVLACDNKGRVSFVKDGYETESAQFEYEINHA